MDVPCADTTIKGKNDQNKNGTQKAKIMKNSSKTVVCEVKSMFQFNIRDVVWRNVLVFLYVHLAALYGIYLYLIGEAGLTLLAGGIQTVIYYSKEIIEKPANYFVCPNLAYALAFYGGMGITAGAHRLWCHRSYKAKWPLRLILAIANTASFQNSIYDWVRDHRYI